MELDKRFGFSLKIEKARHDDQGRMMVTAIAADTVEDRTGEKFDYHALEQILRNVSDGLPLLPSHKDSFGFGKSVAGRIVPLPGVPDGYALEVDFELFPHYPQAQDLFKEIQSGTCQKELSVGGKLVKGSPRAAYYTKGGVKVLHDVAIDHICTARKSAAANPRTKFTSSVFKTLAEQGLTDEVWKTLGVDEQEEEALSAVSKDFPMALQMTPMSPGLDVPSREEDRRVRDLPTFDRMKNHGFNAYFAPLYFAGDPALEALRAIKRGRNGIVFEVEPADASEDVLSLMAKAGIPDPQSHVRDGKVPLFAAFLGTDDLDNPAVGMEPGLKSPALYAFMPPPLLNGGGELEFDEMGRLKGGFLFTSEGRKLPGESGYSPYWPIPSVTEAQILMPRALAQAEDWTRRQAERNGESEAETKKVFDADLLEKVVGGNFTGFGFERTTIMPFSFRRLKIRTKSAEGHSHELRITLDPKGSIMRGATADGPANYQPNAPLTFENHVHQVDVPTQKLRESEGHTHEFELPPGAVMEEKEMLKVIKTDADGYFSLKGRDVVLHEKGLPEGASSDSAGRREQSFAMILYRKGRTASRTFGHSSLASTYAAAARTIEGGDVDKIVVGSSVGWHNKSKLYRIRAIFTPDSGDQVSKGGTPAPVEADKVIAYRKYPLSDTTSWGFSGEDASAVLGNNDWTRFANAHTWYDPSLDPGNTPPRVQGAYRLPHHKMEGDELRTFPRGVVAAMAAVNGARGGVNIPAGEMRGVYNHLARHYEDMGREAPPFRDKQKALADGEWDQDYLKEFVEFHKGLDLSWLEQDAKPKNLEGGHGMNNDQKPADQKPPVAPVPAAPAEGAEKQTQGNPPDASAIEERVAENIGKRLLKALGLAKTPSDAVHQAASLLKAARDSLKGVKIEEGTDALRLAEELNGLTGSFKELVESGTLKIEDFPEKEAAVLRALLAGTPAPKAAPPAEAVKDAPEAVESVVTREVNKLGEALKTQIAEALKQVAPATPAEPPATPAPEPPASPAPEADKTAPAAPTPAPASATPAASADAPTAPVNKTVEDESDVVKTLRAELAAMQDRLTQVEKAPAISKTLTGQEADGSRGSGAKGVWSGVIPSLNKMRQNPGADSKTSG